MNRRQLFLSSAKAALLTAFGGSWLTGGAKAQTAATAASFRFAPSVGRSALEGSPPGEIVEFDHSLGDGSSRQRHERAFARNFSTASWCEQPSPASLLSMFSTDGAATDGRESRQRRTIIARLR